MKRICAGLLLIGCLAACSSKVPSPVEDEEVQQANRVVIFESKDSQNKWILQSDKVDFEDINHAVLFNPHLMLRQEGQDSVEVTGKRGLLDYTKKRVTIEGNARIHSLTENALLTTERFFYDIDPDRIWSDKKTFVTRGNAKVTARGGIETDSKLRKIEIKQQTTLLPQDPNELREVAK